MSDLTENLTDRQKLIIELLKVGYQTGAIQQLLGAARSTISKCKKWLSKNPDHDLATLKPDQITDHVIQVLLSKVTKPGSDSLRAAGLLLRHAKTAPSSLNDPSNAERHITTEEAVELLHAWSLPQLD